MFGTNSPAFRHFMVVCLVSGIGPEIGLGVLCVYTIFVLLYTYIEVLLSVNSEQNGRTFFPTLQGVIVQRLLRPLLLAVPYNSSQVPMFLLAAL